MNPNAQENWDHQLDEIIQGHVQNMVDDFRRLFDEVANTLAAGSESTGTNDESLTQLKESVDTIHAASGQREMAQQLLDAAGRQAIRAAIFLVRGDDCVGFQATGFGTQDGFADHQFSPTENDPLARAIHHQEAQQLPGSALESSVLKTWIQETPTHTCLAPIVVAGRTVGIIYADSGADAGSIHPEAVEILASVAAMYLDRMRHRDAQTQDNETPQDREATSTGDEAGSPAMETAGEGTHSMAVGATTEADAHDTEAIDPGTAEAGTGADSAGMSTPAADPGNHAIDMGVPETDTGTDAFEMSSAAADPGNQSVDMSAPAAGTPTHAVDMGTPEDTDDWQPEVPAAAPVDLDGADSSLLMAPTPEAAPGVESIPVEPAPGGESEALPVNEMDLGAELGQDPMPPAAAPPSIERGEGVPEQFDPSATMAIPLSPEPMPVMPEQRAAPTGIPATEESPDLAATTQMDATALPLEATPDFGSTMQMEIPPELRQSQPTMPAAEPAAPTEPAPQPAGTAEISEEARRFARLLVSEIVLYNQAAVQTGQQKGDLYARLQDSIDRSREAFNERFDASQAAGFEDELIKTLAMGKRELLGPTYTGA